jgi:hypothetical protein
MTTVSVVRSFRWRSVLFNEKSRLITNSHPDASDEPLLICKIGCVVKSSNHRAKHTSGSKIWTSLQWCTSQHRLIAVVKPTLSEEANYTHGPELAQGKVGLSHWVSDEV